MPWASGSLGFIPWVPGALFFLLYYIYESRLMNIHPERHRYSLAYVAQIVLAPQLPCQSLSFNENLERAGAAVEHSVFSS